MTRRKMPPATLIPMRQSPVERVSDDDFRTLQAYQHKIDAVRIGYNVLTQVMFERYNMRQGVDRIEANGVITRQSIQEQMDVDQSNNN